MAAHYIGRHDQDAPINAIHPDTDGQSDDEPYQRIETRQPSDEARVVRHR